MKKLLLLASVCSALATPAFAGAGVKVIVETTNISGISQGGRGNGQVNVALVAQGTIANIAAPTNAPTISIHNFGITPVE